ncbi:MAG: endopeptidase La [Mariprofundales bacterium]|nr:endopeptidase La [Mariprofundales bacterium]
MNHEETDNPETLAELDESTVNDATTAEAIDDDADDAPAEGATENVNLIPRSEILPEQLQILPLSNRPLFPGLIVPLVYESDALMDQIRSLANSGNNMVGLIMVRDEEAPFTPDNLCDVGVVAKIMKAIEIEDHGLHLVVECLERCRIQEWIGAKDAEIEDVETEKSDAEGSDAMATIRARVSYHLATDYSDNIQLRAYTVAIINTIKDLLKHNPMYEEELRLFATRFTVDDPGKLADFAAGLTTADRSELQKVLETLPIFERMKLVMTLLNRELSVSKVQHKIRENIDQRVSEQQRKFFLNEQLREIKRELGLERDPQNDLIKKFKAKAKGLKFSEEAAEVFNEELSKLESLDPSMPDHAVTRNYLDWLVALPWGKRARDRYDLKRAARALNRHHSGLEDIKDRILEFIAVGARKEELGGSILLFVGAPGVGKTSLGKAIADAVNRPFFRFSVGGMHDEAEIKGHRRTYIGAMPGKFIQAFKQVKVSNPVIMIDEVDKIGADARGDPASALLEALDPEQNSDFLDHYLDVRFDLSQVLFLLTANQLDTIPPALRDRAEIIRLPGYMGSEKEEIARKHLLPRQLETHGLAREELRFTPAAIHQMVEFYAREPGVRHLERLLKKGLRKVVHQMAMGKLEAPVTIGVGNLANFIGQPRYQPEPLRCGIGLATGLAWTAMGGVTLSLEAAVIHQDRRGLKVTGQLGKVMQESAEIAFSYVESHLKTLGGEKGFFDKSWVHIHVPEGAVPKDGPSAGITLATALLSLACNQAAKPMAMTGELTLTGEVLAIGGVREKLLAVKRLGLHEVILPEMNRVDVDELPASVADGLSLHFVHSYPEVAALLF